MCTLTPSLPRPPSYPPADEFNRLREGELSAVSQAVQAVQDAIRGRAATVRLGGRDDVPVDLHAAIFVTLNPASRGYGGRSRPPDNLAQLFRPVAMTTPDSDLIAEVSLQADGFSRARQLGRRLVAALCLCSQLLSRQAHYDFGLRALKVVLGSAGAMVARARQARRGSSGSDASSSPLLPPVDEGGLVVEALRINTLSKLTPSDAPRFAALLGDVFPDVALAAAGDAALEEAVRAVMAAWPGTTPPSSAAAAASAAAPTGGGGLVFNAGQLAKVLQLREALHQRVGCVVVGPSGSGKSTLWRVLVAALRHTGARVSVHVVNPKAMPRDRLLGHTDGDTREWSDGVLTAAARAATAEVAAHSGARSLIVLDGDVDPQWVEALNSVLDDNR
jgi:dynein heavy chain 2, cytosolic